MDRRRQWSFQWVLVFLLGMFGVLIVHDMLIGDQHGLARSRDFLIWALVAFIGWLIGRPSAGTEK